MAIPHRPSEKSLWIPLATFARGIAQNGRKLVTRVHANQSPGGAKEGSPRREPRDWRVSQQPNPGRGNTWCMEVRRRPADWCSNFDLPPLPGLDVKGRHRFPWLTPWATLCRRYAAVVPRVGGIAKPARGVLRRDADHARNAKASAGAAMSYRAIERHNLWHHMAAPASWHL